MREKVIRGSIDGSMEMVDLFKKRDVSIRVYVICFRYTPIWKCLTNKSTLFMSLLALFYDFRIPPPFYPSVACVPFHYAYAHHAACVL